MKGVPFARAPAAARSIPGRTSGSASSIGSMNDMASVEPGASAATWRSVAAIAGHDGGAEGPRERAHVRTAAPSVVRSRQLQADFVFEHVRRRIDFYVQRPPQGDPHRSVVRRRHLLVMHDVLSLGFRLLSV